MYQPYRGGDGQAPVERPPMPPSVRNAVRLMYAGAAASLVGVIIGLATGISKTAIHNAAPNLTPAPPNPAGG